VRVSQQSVHASPAGQSVGRGRRVLLAWELGEGLGHAVRLLWLALRLREQGWAPVVAARNPAALVERYRAAQVPVISTPPHRSCFAGPGRFRAASYADIMGVCGYADLTQLAAAVAAWDEVLRTHAPDLIIADYSPLLSLAAFGRIPLICVGDGFVTPPGLIDGHFPPLGDPVPPHWDPVALLHVAQRVQAARGAAQPMSLAQIIKGAGQVVCVPPELDIYAASRTLPATGPWERPSPPLAQVAQAYPFAYLRMSHPLSHRVLQVWQEQQLAGECFLHGARRETAIVLERAGIRVHATPPPLREVLLRASMLIHHGGIGSLEEGLMAGRPQLLLPRHLEQSLNSQHMLASLPGSVCVRASTSLQSLRQRLPALLQDRDGRLGAAARKAATRLTARPGTSWAAMQRLLVQLF
jgi:rhamnosyltransferase subunit B